MKRKDRVKLAISKRLNKIFTHRSGVGNRADPTAWDAWDLRIGRIDVKVHAVWEPSLRVYYKCRRVFFVSAASRKRLYPAVKLLWRLLEFEQWEDHVEMHGEVDDRLLYDDIRNLNDLLEQCDYPPGMALERAAMAEEQRANDAATCQRCGYWYEDWYEDCQCDD